MNSFLRAKVKKQNDAFVNFWPFRLLRLIVYYLVYNFRWNFTKVFLYEVENFGRLKYLPLTFPFFSSDITKDYLLETSQVYCKVQIVWDCILIEVYILSSYLFSLRPFVTE